MCTPFHAFPFQFSLGNLDAKRDWGHAKDFVEVIAFMFTAHPCDCLSGIVFFLQLILLQSSLFRYSVYQEVLWGHKIWQTWPIFPVIQYYSTFISLLTALLPSWCQCSSSYTTILLITNPFCPSSLLQYQSTNPFTFRISPLTVNFLPCLHSPPSPSSLLLSSFSHAYPSPPFRHTPPGHVVDAAAR